MYGQALGLLAKNGLETRECRIQERQRPKEGSGIGKAGA